MSLLLETDKDNTINSHINEFTNRMTLVLVSTLIFYCDMDELDRFNTKSVITNNATMYI